MKMLYKSTKHRSKYNKSSKAPTRMKHTRQYETWGASSGDLRKHKEKEIQA